MCLLASYLHTHLPTYLPTHLTNKQTKSKRTNSLTTWSRVILHKPTFLI